MKQILKTVIAKIITLQAKQVLQRYKPNIVAITGSVGKTSAKEAIYMVVSRAHPARKSEKSFNSEIGVPLTVLGVENAWSNPLKWLQNVFHGLLLVITRHDYPKWLVLEVGADRPGDIKAIASWVKPDIAVITGIPTIPVHVEYFPSPEAVAREKRELVLALKPTGTLVINEDNEHARAMKNDFRGATITYGIDTKADVHASHLTVWYEGGAPVGLKCKITSNGVTVPFEMRGGIGKAHVYSVLAACAVGRAVGISIEASVAAFKDYTPIAGRMRVLPGINGSTLIDDTYNASPIAVEAALNALKEIKTGGRKIAVLGDMLELGKYSSDAHRAIGIQAAQTVDLLVTVGVRAQGIARGAIENGLPSARVRQYGHGDSEKAGRDLVRAVREGDIVLIKGSQGLRMEKASKELLGDSSLAKEALPRQDTAWVRR